MSSLEASFEKSQIFTRISEHLATRDLSPVSCASARMHPSPNWAVSGIGLQTRGRAASEQNSRLNGELKDARDAPHRVRIALRTLFARLGERAGMAFSVFPHMLRHACGYALANAGHDTRALQAWRSPQHPAHGALYRTRARSLKDFWRD